jgi:hypothetical protein
MGIYISTDHLQVIHYYYFFMGVFSLFSAFIFTTAFPSYGSIFTVLFVLHLAISWYVSWVIVKRLRKELVFNMVRYAASHVFIAFLTAGLTILFWYLNILQEVAFMNTVLLINFFVFFVGAIWYIITRFDIVRRFFVLKDTMALRSAMNMAVSVGKEAGMPVPSEIRSYQPGSDEDMDALLLSLWKRRKSPEMKNLVKDYYITHYEKEIEKLRNRIKSQEPGEGEKELVKEYEKLIDEYKTRIINLKRIDRNKE